MSPSHIQKSLMGIAVLLLLLTAFFASTIINPQKTVADVSPCVPSSATTVPNKNSQIVGTFPCATVTPTPRPTATPIPRPTTRPTIPPVVYIPPPRTPDPAPPVTSTPSDPSCSVGEHRWELCGTQLNYSYVWGNQADPGCSLTECMTTPVIYLYPEKQTVVHVSIETPGVIYASGPTYPKGGWDNVMANPSGKISYNGSVYPSLFYEFYVKQPASPTTGIILSTVELKPQLDLIMARFGLNDTERREFIDTWLPQLYALKSPYVFFSLFTQDEKNAFDRVDVVPTPDTTIYLFAYFKPLFSYVGYQYTPMNIPVAPPTRSGFTAVEWGASIDDLP